MRNLIEKNSFYDVNQRPYSPEELQLYRDLTGMPLFDSYDQLMASLPDGNEKSKENKEDKKNKKLYKTFNKCKTRHRKTVK